MVSTVAHAYPWDLLGDPAAADRIAGLGVDAVALAAAYHTVRAATPLHPRHRLVDARHSALYLPVRPQAWRGARLVPAEPSWVEDRDAFGTARAALRAAGLPVYAWTVLTHNSRLGDAHPDLTVRTAFGDRLPYALCPANPDVVEYCRTLVGEIIDVGEPDGVVLEACGPLGFAHGGHHEKTDGTDWGPVHAQLLSLCFCAVCGARYEREGIEVEQLRSLVRAGVDGEPSSVSAVLGEQLAARVRAVRTSLSRDLRRVLVSEVRDRAPAARIVLHASAEEWATGPFATVAPAVDPAVDVAVDVDVDVFTVTCWPGPRVSVPGIRALRELAGSAARIAGYVQALPPRPADGAVLLAEWERYAQEGVAELHLYHAGLASPARLAAMREAISHLRKTSHH